MAITHWISKKTASLYLKKNKYEIFCAKLLKFLFSDSSSVHYGVIDYYYV